MKYKVLKTNDGRYYRSRINPYNILTDNICEADIFPRFMRDTIDKIILDKKERHNVELFEVEIEIKDVVEAEQ